MISDSSLKNIEATTEALLTFIRKIKELDSVTAADRDLLLQEARNLYGQLLLLEPSPLEVKETMEVPEKPVVEETPEVPEEEPTEPEPAAETFVEEEIETPTEQEVPETVEEETVPESMEPEILEEDVVAAPEPEETPEPAAPVSETENETEEGVPEPVGVQEESKEIKTTLDLFSDASENSLGSAFASHQQQRVGEVVKGRIADLREAIGINDKFLFINELFNGDMSRYNKVLDELNQFSGLPGSLTYLSELSVQFNWHKDQTAYQRFEEVLQKKFS
ncbi:MAG: hypothetical protein JXR71_10970 [Bacteroidales bacterium]|nr:hypothetical protein [Bacteroidales bacterium]